MNAYKWCDEGVEVNLIIFKCAAQEENRETKLVERDIIYKNIGFRVFSFGLCVMRNGYIQI